jgi:NAD(P)-dependent dehydrogenase (short-subunit alcohol dehydrogenase family)
LAGAGARVLVHGRDRERGEQTVTDLAALNGRDDHALCLADFSSLEEVRAMGERIVSEHQALDGLVNNAGIGSTVPGGGARMESQDGYELRFQVNYLAEFLLTRLLTPVLVSSAPARIVNVSSAGQMPIDFDDVMLERGYDGMRAYCQSKLAQVMHTFDLAEQLAERGVTANCLHPATFMPTKIVLAVRSATSTLEQGVEATLRLVADPSLDGVTGRYYNGQHESRAEPQAYDTEARRRLSELSERLTGSLDREA